MVSVSGADGVKSTTDIGPNPRHHRPGMNSRKLQHYTSPQRAQAACSEIRRQGLSIGYVATMGALHEGHLSLIRCAQQENDRVIVSIFVNPLQFNNPRDLDKYPRDQATDFALLYSLQVDAVFTGSVNDFLGEAKTLQAEQLADPGPYARGLEGEHRPGHFEGVREIVSRLFNFVGPCHAYFGEKDYQQLQIIRQLATDMTGIEVVACTTSREPGGLARSSRNQRLSKQGQEQAGIIFQAMQAANREWENGQRQPLKLQAAMLAIFEQSPLILEYAELRDPLNWTPVQPQGALEQARVLIAGELEGVRLIDNMALD